MASFLADSSIWGWANSGRRPDITTRLAARIERDEVVTCAPVVLEVLHRARTGDEYEHLYSTLFTPLRWVPVGSDAIDHAIDVQRSLAAISHGNHLRPAIDFMIASAAALAGRDVTLWFFDRDLRIICAHTGQPFEAEASTAPGT